MEKREMSTGDDATGEKRSSIGIRDKKGRWWLMTKTYSTTVKLKVQKVASRMETDQAKAARYEELTIFFIVRAVREIYSL